MFSNCCNESNSKKEYSLIHSPIPFDYGKDCDDILKSFLLYMPNIDSAQSSCITELDETLYDDFYFSYFMKSIGMDEETDVKWYKSTEVVDDAEWNFFHNEICTNCQKLIICRYAKQTKIKNLLRCIRNCIAHGDFTIVDDFFIGFNKDHEKKKAIVKIRYKDFFDSLKELISPNKAGIIKTEMISYALKNVGYEVSLVQGNRCDLVAKKNGYEYFINIKILKGIKFLHSEHILQCVDESDLLKQKQIYVLLIDTSKITKEVTALTEQHKNFRIIDIDNVKQLIQGQDVLKQE